jgi:predicted deacylase
MTAQNIAEKLPELAQIEAIIQRDHKEYLSSRILQQVTFGETTLPIYALTLGNIKPGLPCITFVGGIHGLERIGTQVILAFLESLLQRLHWDLTFTDILERIQINVLPLVNPIGMLRNTRANGQGIDLMRNAPVDSTETTVWLGGGHRISPRLPWYRGQENEAMQVEAQTLSDFIHQETFSAPFSLVLDCHSGFGLHNQIWFPYAKSRIQPIKHLGEVFF